MIDEQKQDTTSGIFEPNKFYKPTQVAAILGISRDTVLRTADRHHLPYVCDDTQTRKMRLYRGSDLNQAFRLIR